VWEFSISLLLLMKNYSKGLLANYVTQNFFNVNKSPKENNFKKESIKFLKIVLHNLEINFQQNIKFLLIAEN
jgi:hypothetical protein